MAIIPQFLKFKKISLRKTDLKAFSKNIFWFTLGALLGFFFFISFLYITYEKMHTGKIYEGVIIDGVNFGGKDPSEVKTYFTEKNKTLQKVTITLHAEPVIATISAKQIDFGYDADLLAAQAMTIGRASDNTLSNMSLILQAYLHPIALPPAYRYSEHKLIQLIGPLKKQIDIKPTDPLFNFVNGKVIAFRLGTDGRMIDEGALIHTLIEALKRSPSYGTDHPLTIPIPIKELPAAVAADEANRLGIKEEVATGTSLFYHSSEDRIFNLSLAANRLNGIIIKPGETFSFVKAVGDISTLTGYRQAYIIQNGKTVLGDGGGVCQVSTTLFRAALHAGLPIIERNQHAYRVGYYEEDSGPGIDAAIYSPTVDLKFKNDTGNALLIQTYIDLAQQRLTFTFYGTKVPTRIVNISTPVVLSETPAPPPLYQDDPQLPNGQVKQIDFAAAGANVFFTRIVKQNGKTTISDKFISNYKPWQAVYLRGTKT